MVSIFFEHPPLKCSESLYMHICVARLHATQTSEMNTCFPNNDLVDNDDECDTRGDVSYNILARLNSAI